MEYSVWTWRWAKLSPNGDPPVTLSVDALWTSYSVVILGQPAGPGKGPVLWRAAANAGVVQDEAQRVGAALGVEGTVTVEMAT
jgi:hypothetical protein